MRTLILTLLLAAPISSAFAGDVYVQPYVRKDGTMVQGHMRSAPNSNPYDNYSAQGNTNPYTGNRGTQNPNDSDGE